jgi:transposase-like protein
MVNRLYTFQTNTPEPLPLQIPAISKAQRGCKYPLHPDTLILFGDYKNNATTRAFFKTLRGPHFHYTARGTDWTRARWLDGKPSTYREYVNFWLSDTGKYSSDALQYCKFIEQHGYTKNTRESWLVERKKRKQKSLKGLFK